MDYRDLYAQVYYDGINENDSLIFNKTNGTGGGWCGDFGRQTFGSSSTFLRGSLVLLLRAGFILIQIGCIPINDVQIILMHNIVDIACSTAAYGFIGYMISFGHDSGGAVGQGMWIMSDEADMNHAVLGWSAVIIATAIFTTMVAGRMNFIGFVIIVILFSMIIQPMIMHWVWSSSGWMAKEYMSNHKLSYKDHAGGCVIHVTGGVLAMVAGLALGRRLLRLREIDESSLTPDSPSSTIIGYLLIIVGLTGMCLATPSYYEKYNIPYQNIARTFMNNVMGIAGGIIAVVIFQLFVSRGVFTYWVTIHCMQGGIAGMVMVAAGSDVYKPLVAFALGSGGALIFAIITLFSFRSALTDNANVIPIHLVCGFLGTLFPPLLGSGESTSHNVILWFGWQIICSLVILLVMFLFAIPLIFIFQCCAVLRNRSDEENHRRALIALAAGRKKSCCKRIFQLKRGYHQYMQPGYRSKFEDNFEEGDARYMGSSQGTPTPSLSSTKPGKSSMKSKRRTRQPVTVALQDSQEFSSVFELQDDEIIDLKKRNMRKGFRIRKSISEERAAKNETKVQERQLFTIHHKGEEDLHRREHILNKEGENKEFSKPTDTVSNMQSNSENDEDTELEIVHIAYKKHKSPVTYTRQDESITGSISCLSRISDIIERHFHESAVNIGEGDCMINVGSTANISNFPQRSTSEPHITDSLLRKWENTLNQSEISHSDRTKEVYCSEMGIESLSSSASEIMNRSTSEIPYEDTNKSLTSSASHSNILLSSHKYKDNTFKIKCSTGQSDESQDYKIESFSWCNVNFDDQTLTENQD